MHSSPSLVTWYTLIDTRTFATKVIDLLGVSLFNIDVKKVYDNFDISFAPFATLCSSLLQNQMLSHMVQNIK